MRVLVAVKRVVDYNVKVKAKADGSGVDLANVKMSMNPFDEIAVEEAVRLKESGKATEVLAVSVGSPTGHRHASFCHCKGGGPGPLGEDRHHARAIGSGEDSQASRRSREAYSRDTRQTGHRRRLQSDRTDVGGAAWGGRRGRLRRRSSSTATAFWLPAKWTEASRPCGSRRRLWSRPTCVSTSPAMKRSPNIMKAKKKPIEEKSPADLAVDMTPRLQVLKTSEPPGRAGGAKVASVAELVNKLKNESGVL